MTSKELVKKLNGDGDEIKPYIPVMREGQVVSFFQCNDADEEVPFTLADLGVDKGWLDEHPEGEDRGGYVPFVFAGEAKAFFHSGEWQRD